jgi:hypothetical protein
MSRICVWLVGGTVAILATLGWWLTGPEHSPRSSALAAQMEVEQPAGAVELYVTLGLKDTEQVDWMGSITLSEGRLRQLRIVRAARNATAEGNEFAVRAARSQAKQKKKREQMPLIPARLHLALDAPDSAQVTISTSQGEFSFVLGELQPGSAANFLDDQAAVERKEGAVCLTPAASEDDYPAMVKSSDGTIWLAYVAFTPSEPLINERVLQGNFDVLVPSEHGDQILLRSFDGNTWHVPVPATDPGRDVWRPSIAVDLQDRIWVAWAEKVDDDWEILARRYDPAEKTWSEQRRVSNVTGSDFHVVATCDAKGQLWLAWQGWRDGGYDILLATADDAQTFGKPRVISDSPGNDWSPAICADSQGQVYVAWDTYAQGNYDIRLLRLGNGPEQRIKVADTPRFEARPTIVCDQRDQLWVGYEEGDQLWGKDYLSDNNYARVGFDGNPGNALYVQRTVRLKCWSGGEWKQPAGNLEQALSSALSRNKSHPRLAVDDRQGLWLLVRHHPLPGGNGEAWHSYAFRYAGNRWEGPRELTNSANLLDNRPALAAHGDGMLVVYSGDYRTRTQDRDQTDLFSAWLQAGQAGEAAEAPVLASIDATQVAAMQPVHENESDDIDFIRNFRVDFRGKQLRLLRGEFHRHTEFTAHRDQDGSLEDSWRYALDAADLDWMGNGDHDNGLGHEYMWWLIQKMSDLHHHPQQFVAAMTYERSLQYPNGHRNVMMPRRGIRPLPRGSLESSEEAGTVDTKILYAYLKHFGGICASHTSGTNMGTDWRDNDPDVEPIVEIYQGHRHNYEHFGAPRSPTAETQIGGYQPAGFVWNALEKGYRLGFQSSSDHVSTHMSYAMVLVEDFTRQGIIDGFKQRHCYAATDNILLLVRSGEHLMGDEFETSQPPRLTIDARGTGPLARVHVVRNNKYVYTNETKEQRVQLNFTDMDAQPGQSYYYYVRVEQADGNLAWGSPMWVTYRSR